MNRYAQGEQAAFAILYGGLRQKLRAFLTRLTGTPVVADDLLQETFKIGLTVALPMLLLSVWAARRSFPSGAGWRGAALGAACGLGGVVVLVHLCGSPFSGHIAVAHGLPLLIATLGGALGGVRLGRIR